MFVCFFVFPHPPPSHVKCLKIPFITEILFHEQTSVTTEQNEHLLSKHTQSTIIQKTQVCRLYYNYTVPTTDTTVQAQFLCSSLNTFFIPHLSPSEKTRHSPLSCINLHHHARTTKLIFHHMHNDATMRCRHMLQSSLFPSACLSLSHFQRLCPFLSLSLSLSVSHIRRSICG